MNDLVIGLATGYTWHQIEPWAISLIRTGYQGVKGIVLDDSSPDLVGLTAKLESLGITVFQIGPWGNRPDAHMEKLVIVQDILAQQDFRFVVLTDLRDLVFQLDPITWLEQNLTLDIAVSSECIIYSRNGEPWNYRNMGLSFGPDMLQQMDGQEVFCSGVIAGRAPAIQEFFRDMYFMSCAASHGLPDQAAMNILISKEPRWQGRIQQQSVLSGMALHAGDGTLPYWFIPERPEFRDGKVWIKDKLFCMVHQYDTFYSRLRSIYRE